MKKSVQEKARDIIQPIAKDLGYTLIEVLYKKTQHGMELAVTIDKENGITLNDCEQLSRALDNPLDENDITNGTSYNLTVSSYGLNRSLKTDYDFNKFLQKEITIKFYKPFLKEKEIVCVLKEYKKTSIIILYNNEEHEIDLKDTANIKPFIKF